MAADASASHLVPAQATAATATELPATPEPTEASGSGPLLGDPMMLGLPCFIVGWSSGGLALIGVVPAAAIGAAIPDHLTATSQSACSWRRSGPPRSARARSPACSGSSPGSGSATRCSSSGSPTAGSASPPASAQAAQELFLVAWLVVIVMLTLATLRLPVGVHRRCSSWSTWPCCWCSSASTRGRPGLAQGGRVRGARVRRDRRVPVRILRLGRHRRAPAVARGGPRSANETTGDPNACG